MDFKKSFICTFVWLLAFGLGKIAAQIPSGLYISKDKNLRHEVKINNKYFIYSVYEQVPANFIETKGGFYTENDGVLNLQLEFNSAYENDSVRELLIPYTVTGNELILKMNSELIFLPMKAMEQDLDGAWLFATRGPDNGQDRRGEENPRKTLKFLLDGRFQWIAYHTETMKFSGTGGGSYSSKNGIYTEKIEYFSKDNSRVGTLLEFDYEIKGDDWHHTGQNSKGEPMYEIWSRRAVLSKQF